MFSSKGLSQRSQEREAHQRFPQWQPRSLRARLMLWYGIFFVCIFVFFALLLLVLIERELTSGVERVLQAEGRVVANEVQDTLQPSPPYWPASFSLPSLNPYSAPGVVIEVLDKQGRILYDSDQKRTPRIPLQPDIEQTVQREQVVLYQNTIDNEPVQILVSPVKSPSSASGQSVIGMIVIAKSLNDFYATLLLLRTLVIGSCIFVLLSALFGNWFIASRVLNPLAELARTARAVAASTASGTRIGTLNLRVRRPRGKDEMVAVVDAFNAMLADLNSASQVQRRFIADASHELRAPLTTIRGNLAFLRRHRQTLPPEEQNQMLADAYNETLRLHKLVEELLFLARADAASDASTTDAVKTETRAREMLELDHILLQLLRQVRVRLKNDGEKVRLEAGEIAPVRVPGDEEAFRRIALILLDNALKYTPPREDGSPGLVRVSLTSREQRVELVVEDNGIGIAPEDQVSIFDRFYRADRARSRDGTGLGLAIAKTLVDGLGGTITVNSTPGQGSRFVVSLPA